jgi:pyruvate dehydrogenase E2 component (dihydrolipoamide acetyltransferase)
MSAAILFRKDLNEKGKVKVSFNDLLMRACVLAFKQVPNMNAAWGGDCTIYREQVDLGLAVAIEEGLIVPVLRNVNNKSISDIARESAVLVEKARKKRLTPDEYGSASITVSNLGMFGVDRVFPIINPGESGILGVGRIAEKVVVMNGGIHIRNMMPVVLACDHRIVDGATGAQFFKAVKDAMETPSGLV